ncbi:P-loop containing nucleoside triphosphate hydrolase protein [Violaceomyces palustris]|uniref:P-loop containing nucleoside triphosphate hydrolase protein n=1 Tax=Violaceomyces palustris TaxID=1673888 RepID=A0ACD0P1Q7_9BASI|nr:P-loop containing nucleoside triphosphate hydrolase protein [Violaceomyces palustris]
MLKHQGPDSKAVYLAPTKALCSEKVRDWSRRMQHLHCPVAELTGDTGDIRTESTHGARIIVTTPEKWDIITRRWLEQKNILSDLKLLMIDEVHILNEKPRGARLEVVVSRMKMYGSQIRIGALSATIPNVVDIATWIGSGEIQTGEAGVGSAKVFKFGEEFRPCPIKKFVYGYPKCRDEFVFTASLNQKLMSIITKHSRAKPCLIFVSTRKATSQSAEFLARQYRELVEEKEALPWPIPAKFEAGYLDKRLNQLASLGIAYHHAGLDLADRRAVEGNFLNGRISVLCCTSTLATGVNLPAYCVILRGTKQYTTAWSEFSELDFIQMIGRAGRPQFDREGVAVVMCEQEQRQRYADLVSGTRDIESTLGSELVEHINAEIGLKGCSSYESIERWLEGTFFYVRLKKNPAHYNVGDNKDPNASPKAILKSLCLEALDRLHQHNLITRQQQGDKSDVDLTSLGDIMAKYFLPYNTMLTLSSIKPRSGAREILFAIANADEFLDIRVRPEEKTYLSLLRSHPEIRYPPARVTTPADKVVVLIQIHLAGINVNEVNKDQNHSYNPINDSFVIFRHAPRIAKAVMDIALERRDGAMFKSAFDLCRSLNGKAWDSTPIVLKQIEGIGEKSVKILAAGGILSLSDVAQCDPRRIELLLSRQPPFGNMVVTSARSLPQFSLMVEQRRVNSPVPGEVIVTVEVTVGLSGLFRGPNRSHASGRSYFICVLSLSSDQEFFDFRRMPIKKLKNPVAFQLHCSIKKRSQKIVIYAACDEVAGSAVRAELRPNLGRYHLPVPEFNITKSEEELFEEIPDEKFDFEQSMEAGNQNPNLFSNLPGEFNKPERLPNGHFKCKHHCKGLCRHLCCSDGMIKPPKGLPRSSSSFIPFAAPSGRKEENKDLETGKTLDQKEREVLARIERLNSIGGPCPDQQASHFLKDPLSRSREYVDAESDMPNDDQQVPSTRLLKEKSGKVEVQEGAFAQRNSVQRDSGRVQKQNLVLPVKSPAITRGRQMHASLSSPASCQSSEINEFTDESRGDQDLDLLQEFPFADLVQEESEKENFEPEGTSKHGLSGSSSKCERDHKKPRFEHADSSTEGRKLETPSSDEEKGIPEEAKRSPRSRTRCLNSTSHPLLNIEREAVDLDENSSEHIQGGRSIGRAPSSSKLFFDSSVSTETPDPIPVLNAARASTPDVPDKEVQAKRWARATEMRPGAVVSMPEEDDQFTDGASSDLEAFILAHTIEDEKESMQVGF